MLAPTPPPTIVANTRLNCWAAALVLLCVVCERTPSRDFGTTKPRHGPDEAWTNLGAEPEWIDPGKCSDSSGGAVAFNLFAGLTQSHPKTLRAMPDVARGWDISADGLVYTFHLRPTQWSDGTPLTAHDFEYAWKRVLDRETASKYASFLFPVKNAEAFNARQRHRVMPSVCARSMISRSRSRSRIRCRTSWT